MAVKIRLSRIGRKHLPFFRVVAVDSRKKRDGMCLDDIGTYDALKGKVVRFNMELYAKWMDRGAILTDSALKVFRIYKAASKNANVSAAVVKPVKASSAVSKAVGSGEAL